MTANVMTKWKGDECMRMENAQFREWVRQLEENGSDEGAEQVFENMDLSGVRIGAVNFGQSRFVNCMIDNCRFVGTRMNSVQFVNCQVDSTDMQNVQMRHGRYVNTRLRMLQADGGSMDELQVEGGDWQVVYMMGVELQGMWMSGLDVKRSIFQGSSMGSMRVERVTMEETRFLRSNISNCVMSDSAMFGTSFDEVAGQSIPNGKFRQCHFMNSFFSGVELPGVEFTGCNFRNSAFNGALLDRTTFGGSHLVNTNFYGARFHMVDFRGVDLSDSLFDDDVDLSQLLLDPGAPVGQKQGGNGMKQVSYPNALPTEGVFL